MVSHPLELLFAGSMLVMVRVITTRRMVRGSGGGSRVPVQPGADALSYWMASAAWIVSAVIHLTSVSSVVKSTALFVAGVALMIQVIVANQVADRLTQAGRRSRD